MPSTYILDGARVMPIVGTDASPGAYAALTPASIGNLLMLVLMLVWLNGRTDGVGAGHSLGGRFRSRKG